MPTQLEHRSSLTRGFKGSANSRRMSSNQMFLFFLFVLLIPRSRSGGVPGAKFPSPMFVCPPGTMPGMPSHGTAGVGGGTGMHMPGMMSPAQMGGGMPGPMAGMTGMHPMGMQMMSSPWAMPGAGSAGSKRKSTGSQSSQGSASAKKCRAATSTRFPDGCSVCNDICEDDLMTIIQNMSPIHCHKGRTLGLGKQGLLAILYKGTGYSPQAVRRRQAKHKYG